jgi:hypothetical protein
MATHTTEKGTKLKIIDIKGKPYMQVAERLIWFREVHPDWTIITSPVEINDLFSIFKAAIINEKGTTISTAHKKETPQAFPDYIEKAETSAIGRALAFTGFGTQFAEIDLDEGERLADSPVQPKNVPAQLPQEEKKFVSDDPGSYVVKFGKYKGLMMKNLKPDEITGYCRYLSQSTSTGKPISIDAKEFMYAANLYLSKEKPEEDVPF